MVFRDGNEWRWQWKERDGEGLFGDVVEGLFDEGRTGILHTTISGYEPK